MSRRRGKSLTPSLFPFLAVLVCTLGTLILLLALVAQDATTSAEQTARAEQQARAEDAARAEQIAADDPKPPRLSASSIGLMLREEKFRVEQLVAFRDQQTAEVENRRDQLTHLEDHRDRLREQLKQMSDEVDYAIGQSGAETIDQQMIAELRTRIESEKAAVKELQADAEHKTPRVVIVPHKGPNGTDRRPVYIECDPQGVTIWPEGSRITLSELEDSSPSANPLDAALRTIRLHAMKHYGDSVPPYPLLVVRPEGIETYAAARQAMGDWDDQFGYELVPADIRLAFTKPDHELRQRVDVAIRTATDQQQARRLLVARAGSGGRAMSGSHSATGRTGRLPVLSAASLDREGRANGFSSLRDSSIPSPAISPSYGNPSQTVGSGVTNRSGPATGGAYSSANGNYQQDQAAMEARRWAQEMKSAAEEMRQLGGQQGTGVGDAAGLMQPVASGSASDGANRSTTDESQTPISSIAGAENGDPSSPDSVSQDFEPSDSRNGRSEQSDQTTASDPNRSDRQSTASRGTAGGTQSSPGATAGSQSQTSASQSASQSASSSSPGQAPPAADMVRRQGRNWALPDHTAGAGGNAIVRTIRAECYPDRFVLLPSGNERAMEVFGLSDGDVDRATLQLATAIRDRIDRWGPALPGGRWEPKLEVLVRPSGELRFHQLRGLMSGSGVEVIGRSSP